MFAHKPHPLIAFLSRMEVRATPHQLRTSFGLHCMSSALRHSAIISHWYQLLVSSFSSLTPVSSLKWLHNGMVIASWTTCSGTPLTHQLWNVDFNDEGVYTCRMELSDGTVVERNLSQPLNVVGMYISSDKPCYPGNIGSYRVCSTFFPLAQCHVRGK